MFLRSMTMAMAVCAPLAVGSTGEAQAAPPKVGDRAPEIALETVLQAPKGSRATLATLKGKVVVLEFWATWCGPCVGAIPHMNELATKFKDKPVQFISITDEKEAVIKAFLKKRSIRSWVGLDTDRSVFKAYGVRGIPLTVLIDKTGKASAFTHPNYLREKILDEMLAGKTLSLPMLDDRSVEPRKEEAESDRPPPLFEVSIRPSSRRTAGGTTTYRWRVEMKALPLDAVFANAFGVRRTRIVNRASLPDGKFDVVARVPKDRRANLDGLLRQALEVTFGVRVRNEKQEKDVYVLTVAEEGINKEGLRSTVSTGGSSMSWRSDRMSAVNQSISSLVGSLEEQGFLARPVLDQTGLEGGFDWEIKCAARDEKAVTAALREQLGLDLKPAREAVEVLVIEKAG